MVKQDRRPHLSPVFSDHHPAIRWESGWPVPLLSGQSKTQGYLFPSPARSQALVEANDSRYVIICGETNVHDHDSYMICPELTRVTQANSRFKDVRRIHIPHPNALSVCIPADFSPTKKILTGIVP